MDVIDVDPELLRRSADAALHAAEQTWIHIDAEVVGDIPGLMDTLVPEEPYAYTILPEINPDGSVRSPVLTTREEIRKAYEIVRGRSALLNTEPVVEVRGAWFTFQEAVSTGHPKGAPAPTAGIVTLAIFPVSTGKGITGELVWPRLPGVLLGRGDTPSGMPTEPLEQRRAALKLHDGYLDAFRAGNVDALLETLNDDVQGAVRDYINDTGTLIELRGKEAHRSFYRALFDKFEVQSVDLLGRVVQDWYVFAEVRVTVRSREGAPATTSAFHLAEFVVLARDGRFIVRIGHGTDPA